MLEKDIIQPSVSPWSSPVVLVKKRDGKYHFCFDYRKLNAVTQKDSYPLHRIDDTLDWLQGTCYFSTLDLQSGYWKCELDPSVREKTAFTTYGPFGLCNAPGTFQQLMESILRGLIWKTCLIYLDDVIVFSTSFDQHLNDLAEVFDRFRDANIKLKPSKCSFEKDQVSYLGHIISKDGIQPDPEKIEVVKNFPVPKTVRQVRSFLGLANYYRRFVQDIAKIA